MKKYLIFSGVGDNDKQYISWAQKNSSLYDRAINYYGDSAIEYEGIKQLDCEYLSANSGMVFKNFADKYELFKDYEYVLICDADLEINSKEIEETFERANDNNWSACTWSRARGDCSSFNLFATTGSGVRTGNFIEMCFMVIRKDLLKLLVDKWNELNLEYSTGIDLILSNVALHNKMMPFYVIDDYTIYNPHPEEKINGRELTNKIPLTFSQRMKKLHEHFIATPSYWKIHDCLCVGDRKIYRTSIKELTEKL